MQKKYDAVATIGKYKDREGNEKSRYLNVGSVFEGDDGRLSMKMDALPTSPEWSGWISFYEPKQDGARTQSGGGSGAGSYAKAEPKRSAAGGVVVDKDDDIPF